MGLNFIPAPGKPPPLPTLIKDIGTFTRRLRLHLYYNNNVRPNTGNLNNRPLAANPPGLASSLKHFSRDFRLPSLWTPPISSVPRPIRHVITSLLSLPYNTPFVRNKSNISVKQCKLLRSLADNNDIVVTCADKGGGTVILDTVDYNREALRQLSDAAYYRKIPNSLALDNYDNIRLILSKLLKKQIINVSMFAYFLRPLTTVKPRRFYLLPKIHKPRDKWADGKIPPGRPIVSDVASESYFTAKLLTALLADLPPTLPAFVKNSFEFKQRVAYFKLDNINNFLLVTADIDSLYTNMNIERCISLTRTYLLSKYSLDIVNNMCELLRINLCSNDFRFGDSYYVQTCGVAMGKSFAPHLANLYLQDFDERARDSFNIKPLLYTRYIDDVFFVWPGSLSQLSLFETYLNSLIPGIRLNFSHDPLSISFLDTTVFVDNLTLLTKVYFKPTDRRTLLSHSSFHPSHTFPGIVKSQFIRYRNLCCSQYHYLLACSSLVEILSSRGYNGRSLRRLAHSIWEDSPRPSAPPQGDRLFLSLTYNATNRALARQVRHLLSTDLPDLHVTTAWRSNRNLRSLLR